MPRVEGTSVAVRTARPGYVDVMADFGVLRSANYERAPDQASMLRAEQLHDALSGPAPRAFADLAEHGGDIVGMAVRVITYRRLPGTTGSIWRTCSSGRRRARPGGGPGAVGRVGPEAVSDGDTRLEWSVLDWNEPAIGFDRTGAPKDQ